MVLCAGRGMRLGDLTTTIPKTMLEVDGGWTILDRSLAALAKAGAARVSLVVGHGADALERRAAEMESRHSVTLTLVHNSHHASRNNAYSLALGLEGRREDLFVVNGDTLFEAEALERLADAPPAPVTLAIDRVKLLGEEEMKTHFGADGHLQAISKRLDPATAHGEYIGLARVDGSHVSDLVTALDGVWTRDPSLFYEDAFGDLAVTGVAISMVDVGDLPWIEVDTPGDLERARMMSWHS